MSLLRIVILSGLVLIRPSAFANDAFNSDLETCLRGIGSKNIEVIGFSESAKTLVYVNENKETRIVKAGHTFEVNATPASACKPIDGQNLDSFTQSITDQVRKLARESKTLSQLSHCVDALNGLGYENHAAEANAAIVRVPVKRVDSNSATK